MKYHVLLLQARSPQLTNWRIGGLNTPHHRSAASTRSACAVERRKSSSSRTSWPQAFASSALTCKDLQVVPGLDDDDDEDEDPRVAPASGLRDRTQSDSRLVLALGPSSHEDISRRFNGLDRPAPIGVGVPCLRMNLRVDQKVLYMG